MNFPQFLTYAHPCAYGHGMTEAYNLPSSGNVPKWDLADRLRKSLDHAGMSPNEMAEYLEVHRNTISNWINGRAQPRPSDLKLWALRTGVSYEWITEGHEGDNTSRIKALIRPVEPEVGGDTEIDNQITALRTQLGHGQRRDLTRKSRREQVR